MTPRHRRAMARPALSCAILALGVCACGSAYVPRDYYGARFEPVDKVIHGAGQATYKYDDLNYAFERYGDLLGPDRYPLTFMGYCNVRNSTTNLERIKSRLDAIQQTTGKYCIPQIGCGFPSDPSITPESNAARIQQFCDNLKALGRPAYLRLGYEFNGSWYTPMYQPESYIAWFRAITEKLRSEGVPAATLWCAYPGWGDPTFGSWDYISRFYPGDDYVDWWCADIFGAADITHPELGLFLDNAELHAKPVVIGEATARAVGTDSPSDWDTWFAPFFDLIHSRPGIKGHTYINWDWTQTTEWTWWGDCRLETADPYLQAQYLAEMSSDLYYDAQSEAPYFVPEPAGILSVLAGAAVVLPLRLGRTTRSLR